MILKPTTPQFSPEFLEHLQHACEEFEHVRDHEEEWSYSEMMDYAFEQATIESAKPQTYPFMIKKRNP